VNEILARNAVGYGHLLKVFGPLMGCASANCSRDCKVGNCKIVLKPIRLLHRHKRSGMTPCGKRSYDARVSGDRESHGSMTC
jgi:hypothetical protein